MYGLTTCGPWPDKAVFKGVRDLALSSRLVEPNVNDAVFEELLKCPNLESLTLAYTSITPATLAKLGQFTKLKYSGADRFAGRRFSRGSLWRRWPTYKPCDWTRPKLLTRRWTQSQQFKQLTNLHIGQTAITDRGLAKLLDKKQLEVLDCSSLPLGDEANRTFTLLSIHSGN